MVRQSPSRNRWGIDASTVLLWLCLICVIAGIYLYQINILWTLLIALLISLLLGLLTLSLVLDDEPEVDSAVD